MLSSLSPSPEKFPAPYETDCEIVEKLEKLEEPTFEEPGRVRQLMRDFTADEVAEYIAYTKERLFALCDEETRRTGALTKMVAVVDLEGFRWSEFDQRFLTAMGKAEQYELFYPQLLGQAVVVNAPRVIGVLWGLARRVLPANTREKVRICTAGEGEAEGVPRVLPPVGEGVAVAA